MEKYHKYVFDTKKRKLIGNFEKMYSREEIDGFDSWHQDDDRQIQRKIIKEFINSYNIDVIIDLGCGKGGFTHTFKKINNKVIGIDVSETAVRIAKFRYPDIEWHVGDVGDYKLLKKIYKENSNFNNNIKMVLTFTSELLSYLNNWEEVIKQTSKFSNYFLISLFIPPDPIGFIKNPTQLIEVISKYYNIVEIMSLEISRHYIIFAESTK